MFIAKGDGDLTYAATDLTLGVIYHARIRATNAAGAGDWSNVFGVSPHPKPQQLALLPWYTRLDPFEARNGTM